MNYSNVTNCKYVAEDQSMIGCQVTFSNLGTVYFVASATDSEAHGREIYSRARNGEFGSIAAFVPIRETITNDQKINQERNKRDALLSQLDSLISSPLRWQSLSEQDKNEISSYRSSLLNVPQQEGFPDNIVWPTAPGFVLANVKSVQPIILI
jgi:Phage tail assembly chaperone protein